MGSLSWAATFGQNSYRPLTEITRTNKIVLVSVASASFYFLIFPKLQKRLEFFSLKSSHDMTEPYMREHKVKLFSDIGTAPKVGDELVLLELGIGPGCNLEYYPKGIHVIASDLHALGEKEIAKKCKTHGLNFRGYVVAGAEDLSMIETESVSVVIMTLVLCSVENMEDALMEIKRVLVPGGKFYFFEHTRNFENNFIRSMLQLVFFAPQLSLSYCNIRRNQLAALLKVFGKPNVEFEQFILGKDVFKGWLFYATYATAPILMGKATKEF